MSVNRRAWSALLIAASLATAEAREVSGAFVESTSKATLFSNIDTTSPNAKDSSNVASAKNLEWTVSNLTWKDEDTAIEYMEITTELTADILSTDTVVFHVEFTSDKQSTLVANSQLIRDGFECSLTKDVSTDYWQTTVKDVYVRTEGTTTDDFSNSFSNNGQDWEVNTEDVNRAENDHLCTASSTSDLQCSKIKCVVRRALSNSDADDMQFKPDASSPNKMTFPKLKSWLMLNQSTYDSTKRKIMETQQDKDITILQSAILSTTFSLATSLATIAAFTMF